MWLVPVQPHHHGTAAVPHAACPIMGDDQSTRVIRKLIRCCKITMEMQWSENCIKPRPQTEGQTFNGRPLGSISSPGLLYTRVYNCKVPSTNIFYKKPAMKQPARVA